MFYYCFVQVNVIVLIKQFKEERGRTKQFWCWCI